MGCIGCLLRVHLALGAMLFVGFLTGLLVCRCRHCLEVLLLVLLCSFGYAYVKCQHYDHDGCPGLDSLSWLLGLLLVGGVFICVIMGDSGFVVSIGGLPYD